MREDGNASLADCDDDESHGLHQGYPNTLDNYYNYYYLRTADVDADVRSYYSYCVNTDEFWVASAAIFDSDSTEPVVPLQRADLQNPHGLRMLRFAAAVAAEDSLIDT